MNVKLFIGLLTYLAHTTLGIPPPAFVSSWIPIKAHGTDNEVEIVTSHMLGELPMKVDVKIRVLHDGKFYYFNAQSSAQSGDYNSEYGGVIYMFDESNVRIVAPGPSNCPGCDGSIVLLGDGSSKGPTGLPTSFKEGHVQIRAWRMCTFGKPALIQSILIDNEYATFGEINHGLMDMEMLIVHVHLPGSSYIVHGEDLAHVRTTTQPFGGIMFAYNNKNIRFFAPRKGSGGDANGVPFAAVSGWGISGTISGVSYTSDVTATLFGFFFGDFEISPKKFSVAIYKGHGTTDLDAFTVTDNLDKGEMFIILTIKPEYNTGDAFGYKFFVPGSTNMNSTGQYNGLAYGYSGNTIYLWRPPGCMITIGDLWGDGTKTDCSTRVEVTASGINLNHTELVCGDQFGCSATRIGPMCACGSSGMEGQFCSSPVQCPAPTDTNPANVVIPAGLSFSFNTTLTFSCRPGYQYLNGSLERTCTYMKNWTGDPMVCERVPCGEPDIVPDSGSYVYYLTSTVFEGEAYYTCQEGYGISSGSSYRYCQADGLWSGVAPSCNISCGLPVLNGTRRISGYCITVGCETFFTCAIGYENFVGNTSRYCEMSGEWTGIPPSCLIKHCPIPLNGDNSQLNFNTTHYMSLANYTCDEGYASIFNSTITDVTSYCQDDKTWSEQPLDCERVTCPYPVPGILVQPIPLWDYRYGDNVTYECITGYMLANGSLERTCQANQTWSGDTPNCKDLECPIPEQITNGYVITTGLAYGAQAVAVCNDGAVVMAGDMVRMCNSNGSWEGQTNAEPVCEEVWIFRKASNLTYDSHHLVVNVQDTSRYRRSKSSVFYSYPSHIALGCFGILVIVSVCLYICSLDVIRIDQTIKNKLLNKNPKRNQKVYKVFVTRR